MSDIIIKAEGLSKKYLIGHQSERERYTALRDVMARNVKGLWNKTRQVLSGQQLLAGDEIEEFWALRDINFEINRGDRVGIIGRNGAGKSTLLKVLSRITEPSEGKVTIKGRVASLLEVGTGFHPELTGRENIYLNGAILGMTRNEIKKKFDEIVDFAGVEKFLDTPVKRYSSGMYVRLAFAVAAHLEPEILVVDEVLAVGDAEFQKKCLGKMEEVGKSGRTIIFVSHNMAAIQKLCTSSMSLNKGEIIQYGNTTEVIEKYLSINNSKISKWEGIHKENEFIKINLLSIQKKYSNAIEGDEFYINDELIFRINISFLQGISGIAFELFVTTLDGINVFSSFTKRNTFTKGVYDIECSIPNNLFNNSQYLFSIGISKDYTYFIVKLDEVLLIEFNNTIDEFGGWAGEYPGIIRPVLDWSINQKKI